MKKPNETINKFVEEISISAWVIDEDQTVVYMNSYMKDLFGDLSGQKTSMVYECATFETENPEEKRDAGFTEVVIADVHYRRISGTADLGEDGKYTVELFEDISEQKLVNTTMAQALKKVKTETRMAKTIQNSILPINDIYWNTIAFNSLYMPADDVGGDFYDLLKLSDDEYLLYIADVSGHGIQAALLTVFMSERVRANADAALAGTGELLLKLVHDFTTLDIDTAMYITMVFCKYTKSKRELSISNAGHNCSPLIIRDNGRTETIPIQGMPVCALADGMDYEEEIISMNPGDRLLLYTDGIVEEIDSATGRSLGAEGVRELALAHQAHDGSHLARMIIEKSSRYALINAKDDRTIIVADILS